MSATLWKFTDGKLLVTGGKLHSGTSVPECCCCSCPTRLASIVHAALLSVDENAPRLDVFNLQLPTVWAANTDYSVDQRVYPPVCNGFVYNYRSWFTQNSGGDEPDWPTTVGNTIEAPAGSGAYWVCGSVNGTKVGDEYQWSYALGHSGNYTVAFILKCDGNNWSIHFLAKIATMEYIHCEYVVPCTTLAVREGELTGIATLHCYDERIDLLHTWTAGHYFYITDKVKGNARGDHYWECTTAGTSGGTEPAWTEPPTFGNTKVDGGVTWTYTHVPTGTVILTFGKPASE